MSTVETVVGTRDSSAATAKGGHGRGARDEVPARRTDDRGALPDLKQYLTAGCAAPIADAVRRRLCVECGLKTAVYRYPEAPEGTWRLGG